MRPYLLGRAAFYNRRILGSGFSAFIDNQASLEDFKRGFEHARERHLAAFRDLCRG